MQIRAIESKEPIADKYTVIIDNHVFTMSEYPDRPNEVNLYIGDTTDNEFDTLFMKLAMKEIIPPKHIPKNLKYAIRERCKQIRHQEE